MRNNFIERLSFLNNQNIRNYLMLFFLILFFVLCIITYSVFSKISNDNTTTSSFIVLLYADVICLLILFLLCSNKLFYIWSLRNNKGSRLALRLISTFSFISVVPSVMMCVFSAIFFHHGMESWFNKRNEAVLKESLNVAESYLSEHKKLAFEDTVKIARTIEYNIHNLWYLFSVQQESFYQVMSRLLDDMCMLKGVSCALLLDSKLTVIAHSKYSASLYFINIFYDDIYSIVNEGSVFLPNNGIENVIRAISTFKTPDNEYLFLITEKNMDLKTLQHIKNTQCAYVNYEKLQNNRQKMEICFIFVFLLIGIFLLLFSIIFAILYSLKITTPVSNLIDISEKIMHGDFAARAMENSKYEEILLLSKTFNKMITSVHNHRIDLLDINKKLDEENKFNASVLSGVSSGVIGIENEKIYIFNNAATKLLLTDLKIGVKITFYIPELKEILTDLIKFGKSIEREIQYQSKGHIKLLLVKIEDVSINQSCNRFVITIDDMTAIAMTQRKAAWEEVARRVAHEIKNPLTPIQLAAERIKRKYIKYIDKEQDVFIDLVGVIIKQVGDIKRLLDEFNFFARLPEPMRKHMNICDVCKQVIFFVKSTVENVSIFFESDVDKIFIDADERLIHQALLNIVQNAVNALQHFDNVDKNIFVTIRIKEQNVVIDIEDNGPGLPKEKRDYLATPYFTLMPKGTGLGLAIVKKVVQDHEGKLQFEDSVHGGAMVVIELPLAKNGGDK